MLTPGIRVRALAAREATGLSNQRCARYDIAAADNDIIIVLRIRYYKNAATMGQQRDFAISLHLA